LLHLPRKPEDAAEMPDAELVARIEKCQGLEVAARLEHQLKYMVEKGLAEDRVKLREQWLARMWNLSAFVQSVKQRFTVWFNKKHKRKGTLWEERFKSVVLMGSQATAACAAYIDLNPVRAGIVDNPADYRWSGYGEAVAGVKVAREGLIYALTRLRGPMLPAKSSGVNVLEWYRQWIYLRGAARGIEADPERPGETRAITPGFTKEEVKQVQDAEGKLPAVELLRKRVRYFSDGLVVGTKATVKDAFEKTRSYFGPKRKDGPRKMRDGEWGELRSMRDLSELGDSHEWR
jgi:putative transposase